MSPGGKLVKIRLGRSYGWKLEEGRMGNNTDSEDAEY